MNVAEKIVVVTGGGSGIGRALCRRFHAAGARGIVVADCNADAASEVANEAGGLAIMADIGTEQDVIGLVDRATSEFGQIDLFCSNAGICPTGGIEVADGTWQRAWQVNVMAHIYAARAVLPGMLARGTGALLQTCSAAGLLTQIGAAPYAVTKHAAVAFAEWLSITYGARGIKVFCLCPMGVQTDMLANARGGLAEDLRQTALSAEEVADCVIAGLVEERFLILPHAQVAEFVHRKADDHERWLAGMRRWQERMGTTP